MSPTYTGPKLVPGSRESSVAVLSLNAGTKFLGKTQNGKVICVQFNNISAKFIQCSETVISDLSTLAKYCDSVGKIQNLIFTE